MCKKEWGSLPQGGCSYFLPAFLMTISAFFWTLMFPLQCEWSAYFPCITCLECMNSIFFSSQEFSISCLEGDTCKGGGGTSTAIVISLCVWIIPSVLVKSLLHLSNCEVLQGDISQVSVLKRTLLHYFYCEAVPGTERQAKKGSNPLSTALSSLLLYFTACSCITSSCTG